MVPEQLEIVNAAHTLHISCEYLPQSLKIFASVHTE